jgi:ligand-binding sensor domain-containing protein
MSALLLLAAVFTNTARVEGLAAGGGRVWAATGGGVEEIDPGALRVVRVWTTEDGLDANAVLSVSWSNDQLHARTAAADCTLGLISPARFTCVHAGSPSAAPLVAPLFHGARETARVAAQGHVIVGTAGQGSWSFDQNVQIAHGGPGREQVCGNHVEALAEFRGAIWVGAFDGGLCAWDGAAFIDAAVPARMINALLTTPRGLYVAAAEGLFVTRDGKRFRRDPRVHERGVNGLAASKDWLFVTTPVTLYAISLDGRDIVKRWLKPAGSTAIQAVAVSGRNVWLASEDRGAIRMRGQAFTAFDRASGLPSSWLVDVAPAEQGGVWVASLRHGLAQLDAEGALVKRPNLPDPWLLRLRPEGGSLFVGTQGGLFHDGQPVAGLPDPRVHAILRASDGSLWIGTEAGLLHREATLSAR